MAATLHSTRPLGAARLAGLDASRGVAVLSMLVAHLSPVGGLFAVSEYLTAPLFVVVIGAAMGLQLDRNHPGAPAFLVVNLIRGVELVVLGMLLQQLYGQIIVVLPYLGLLIIIMAPLALLLYRVPAVAVGLAAVTSVISPFVMEAARSATFAGQGPWSAWWPMLVSWLASGSAYRVVAFVPMALGGLALAAVLHRIAPDRIAPDRIAPDGVSADRVAPEHRVPDRLPRGRVRVPARAAGALGWLAAFGCLGAAALSYLIGRRTLAGAAPYSGTTAEIVGATFLAASTVLFSCLLVRLVSGSRGRALLEPIVATGRLALTAYTLQILWLALVAFVKGPGAGMSDDSWPLLLSSVIVVFGSCWLFDRHWGTGPLEWLVHRLRPPLPWSAEISRGAAARATSSVSSPSEARGGARRPGP